MATSNIVSVHRCPACGNWTNDLSGMIWRAVAWPFRTPAWRTRQQEAGTCPVCGLPRKDTRDSDPHHDRRVL